MKICSDCMKRKPLDAFYKMPKGGQGRSNVCKACHGAKWGNHYYLYKRFGLTPDAYQQLFEEQGGVCAICGHPETRTIRGKLTRLAVDHDHKTGKVRGLLCYRCNYVLGMLRESPEIARKAADYLEKTGKPEHDCVKL